MVALLKPERDHRVGSQSSVVKGDSSVPPWRDWPERSRAERCIRFIETYCVIPAGFGVGQLMRLHPFQKRAIRGMLARGSKSSGWQVCRGNGKSSLISAMTLWGVCDDPHFPVVPIIAGDMKQVERTLLKPIVSMIKLHPELESRLHTYRAAGDKRVVSWWNGGEILPLPADVDRLQGLQPTLAIVDEGEVVPWDVYWVLRQGGGKRPGSTILMIGTPGPDLGSALYKFRALTAADPAIGTYLEMAAPVGARVDDQRAWMAANPAIRAGFLDRSTVEVEARAALLDPLVEAEFRMRRLGQWPDDGLAMDPLSRALRAAEDVDARPEGRLVWAVDAGFSTGSEAFIAVSDGVTGQIVEHRPGTAWLIERCRELVDNYGGVVALDRGGTIAQRLPDLAQVVPTEDLNAVEVARACARFEEDLLEGRMLVAKGDTEALRAAVAGVQRHGTGDTWRWYRRRAVELGDVDLAPLYALTLAWWVAVTSPVAGVG